MPGYQAPPETTDIAASLMRAILDACAAHPTGTPPGPPPISPPTWSPPRPGPRAPADGALKSRALRVWTRLHGVISLELQGQFAGMDFDADVLFAAEVDSLTRGA
ncbi:TetR-like C-terminal domain-containing protein [Streptomyces sp. M19]